MCASKSAHSCSVTVGPGSSKAVVVPSCAVTVTVWRGWAVDREEAGAQAGGGQLARGLVERRLRRSARSRASQPPSAWTQRETLTPLPPILAYALRTLCTAPTSSWSIT